MIENFSAGALDRMGIGPEVLQAANPRLIVVSMSGLGGTGPWRDYVTYADAVTALSGLTTLALDRTHSAPIVHGFADIVAGLQAALATLAALIDRRRTGSGCVVDLSELEAVGAQIGPGLLELAATGTASSPRSLPHPKAHTGVSVPTAGWPSPSRTTGPGRRCPRSSGAGTSPDRPPLRRTAASRTKHLPELDAAITAWTARERRRMSPSAFRRRYRQAQCRTDTTSSSTTHSYTPHGFYRVLEHPRAGPFLHEGIPIRLSLTPGDLWEPAPLLGADTDAVLETLGGFTPIEIAALHATGALE